jgi:hypothetical protein
MQAVSVKELGKCGPRWAQSFQQKDEEEPVGIL